MPDADKWEKVVRLHRLLESSKYCVPLTKILDELQCSEATFHRVRNYLKNRMGAPIVFDAQYRGYRYDQAENGTYELPGLWLTKNELEALLALDSTIENLGEGYFTQLLTPIRNRIRNILKEQGTSLEKLRQSIRIIPIANRNCDPEIFRKTASAIIKHKNVSIIHTTLENQQATERIISPQTLVRYRDNWYVDAWCHLRNSLRTFALSRISSAEFSKTKYKTIPQKDLENFFAQSYGIFTGPANKTAIIEFSGIAAREVSNSKWHPQQKEEWISENTFRLTIPYGNPTELIMDVLRWGELAKVIEPPELRDTVKNHIEKMKKLYEN